MATLVNNSIRINSFFKKVLLSYDTGKGILSHTIALLNISSNSTLTGRLRKIRKNEE